MASVNDAQPSHGHLVGSKIPSIALQSTSGSQVDLSELSGVIVLFGYPKSTSPTDPKKPDAYYELYPEAKGCTAQTKSFNQSSSDLSTLGVDHVFGISTQSPSAQREMRDAESLSVQLLSDKDLEFAKALKLPTLDFEGESFIKRFNMVIEDGEIVQVLYSHPKESAATVKEFLKSWSRKHRAAA